MVGIETDGLRRLQKAHAGLFDEFAPQGFDRRFAALDTAAGHVPAGHVGVTDHEDVTRLILDGRPHAERDRAADPEP